MHLPSTVAGSRCRFRDGTHCLLPQIREEQSMGPRTVTVLALAAVLACGDDPTEPVLSGPGYVLSVSIPGVTDTTVRGDSVSWFYISGPDPVLGRRQELTLE